MNCVTILPSDREFRGISDIADGQCIASGMFMFIDVVSIVISIHTITSNFPNKKEREGKRREESGKREGNNGEISFSLFLTNLDRPSLKKSSV